MDIFVRDRLGGTIEPVSPTGTRTEANFVGVTVELAGLLREIGLEARALGLALAQRQVAIC